MARRWMELESRDEWTTAGRCWFPRVAASGGTGAAACSQATRLQRKGGAATGSRADLHVGWDGSCRLRGVEVSEVSEVSEAEAEAGVGSVRTMMGRARSERAGEATEEALTHPDHGSGDLIDVERDTPQQRVLQAGPGLGRLKRGVSSAGRQTAPHCTAPHCTALHTRRGRRGLAGLAGLLDAPFADDAFC
jgi:hypothetical protein